MNVYKCFILQGQQKKPNANNNHKKVQYFLYGVNKLNDTKGCKNIDLQQESSSKFGGDIITEAQVDARTYLVQFSSVQLIYVAPLHNNCQLKTLYTKSFQFNLTSDPSYQTVQCAQANVPNNFKSSYLRKPSIASSIHSKQMTSPQENRNPVDTSDWICSSCWSLTEVFLWKVLLQN